jgi:hypothetical protein
MTDIVSNATPLEAFFGLAFVLIMFGIVRYAVTLRNRKPHHEPVPLSQTERMRRKNLGRDDTIPEQVEPFKTKGE